MTTVIVQTRAEWGARPPEAITPLNWSKVTKFIVHYSGATRWQSVRSIQNFCMEGKGHSDIDYNELVRGNVLYIGRGENIGSHTLNNNSTSYGICMIGLDGDATADDMNVIRMRYDWACQRAGRVLVKLGHQDAPTLPPGYTDCPGSQLEKWIRAGMPFVEPESRKVIDMWFLRDDTGAIYASNGVNTRHMPAETLKNTIEPLQAAGVPLIQYKSQTEVFAAGGPLADVDLDVPTRAIVTFPPGTVTFE